MSAKIAIFAGGAHQAEFARAMQAGLSRHGQASEIYDPRTPVACDLAIFWGHRRTAIIDRQRAAKRRYLVMERGYLGDRKQWTSLAYDGLNGYGDFHVSEPVTDQRFIEHHGHLLKPWRYSSGGYALIMGQVPGDASLRGKDLLPWYRQQAHRISQQLKRPVLFRPHPQAIAKGVNYRTGLQEHRGTLSEALDGAGLVVTFNSNSAVDAVLAGVPTITMDRGSMAWAVTGHDVSQIIRPDRDEWFARLAWCQWSIDEISNGDAWAVIGPHAFATPTPRIG